MIPHPNAALQQLAGKLVLGIAPETKTPYAASSVTMIAMLLQCLAKELEHGVEARMRDIDEVRTLLDDARANLPAPLAAEVDAIQRAAPTSLKLTDVAALHARALELLTSVHEHAETISAESLDREIWAFLERMADRHALDF